MGFRVIYQRMSAFSSRGIAEQENVVLEHFDYSYPPICSEHVMKSNNWLVCTRINMKFVGFSVPFATKSFKFLF